MTIDEDNSNFVLWIHIFWIALFWLVSSSYYHILHSTTRWMAKTSGWDLISRWRGDICPLNACLNAISPYPNNSCRIIWNWTTWGMLQVEVVVGFCLIVLWVSPLLWWIWCWVLHLRWLSCRGGLGVKQGIMWGVGTRRPKWWSIWGVLGHAVYWQSCWSFQHFYLPPFWVV